MLHRLEQSLRELANRALIQRWGSSISIHRTLQDSIYYSLPISERQKVINTAADIVNAAFPKQKTNESMEGCWAQCRRCIMHAESLAKVFVLESKNLVTSTSKFTASTSLQELMANSVWHYYEMGDSNLAMELFEKACTMFSATERQNSLHYAHLCNTVAAILFEQNNLWGSEKMLRDVMAIRTGVLDKDDPRIADSHMNFGQVYSARGNFDAAEKEYEQAGIIALRSKTQQLPNIAGRDLMVKGRTQLVRGNLAEARTLFDKSRQCLIEAFGQSSVALA